MQKNSDIPFTRDDAHRLLPWMIACLVGLTALLLMLAFSLSGKLEEQARDVFGTVQVELPSGTSAAMRERVIAALRATPGVVEVAWLTPAQMQALLRPWIGNELALDGLSLPVLIDVKTEVSGTRSVLDIPAARAALEKIIRPIRIEDRGPWLTHMAQAMHYVQALVLLLAAALGIVQGASFAAIPQLNAGEGERSLAAGAVAQLGNLGTTTGTPLLAALIAGFGAAGVVGFAVPLCLGGIVLHSLQAGRRRRG